MKTWNRDPPLLLSYLRRTESSSTVDNCWQASNCWQGCLNNWRWEELTMRTPDFLLLLSVRACWASWRAREGPTFLISSSGLCHTFLQLLVSEAGCCGNVRFGNMNFLCFQLSFSILHNSLVFLTTLTLSESWGGGTLGHRRLLTQYHSSCCWSFRFNHLNAHYFVTRYLSRLWAVNSAHVCLTGRRAVSGFHYEPLCSLLMGK